MCGFATMGATLSGDNVASTTSLAWSNMGNPDIPVPPTPPVVVAFAIMVDAQRVLFDARP